MNAAGKISEPNHVFNGESARMQACLLGVGSHEQVFELREALSAEVVRAKNIGAADEVHDQVVGEAHARVPSVQLSVDTDATLPTAETNELRDNPISEAGNCSLIPPSDVSHRPRLERLEMVSLERPPLVPISAIGDAVIGTSNVQANHSFTDPVISHRPQLDRLETVPSEAPSLLPISAIGKVAAFAEVNAEDLQSNEDCSATTVLDNESNREGGFAIATSSKTMQYISGDEGVLEEDLHTRCGTPIQDIDYDSDTLPPDEARISARFSGDQRIRIATKLSLIIPGTQPLPSSANPGESDHPHNSEGMEPGYAAGDNSCSGNEDKYAQDPDAPMHQPMNHRLSPASAGIVSDYIYYAEDTAQREDPGDGGPIPDFPAFVGGTSTDLPCPKWPRRISSLCDLPKALLPSAAPSSTSIAGRPTTSPHPPHQWPRRTSSLYPTRSTIPPVWSSWFNDNSGETAETPILASPIDKRIVPKPVRSSRQIVHSFHQHQKSMFAQYESIELMSPAVLKQLYEVLGEVLLHVLQHQTVKGKHRRWSTDETLPRAEKDMSPQELKEPTALCEISKGVRKRKGLSMRFLMWRGATETAAEEGKKQKRGWWWTLLGIGAKKPPTPDVMQEIHPQ